MNLGKCCSCECENDSVRNIITLDKLSSEPTLPGGWGCFVCHLSPMGAVAVLCDECLDKFVQKNAEIKFACVGYPRENRRIEIEKLTEVFQHDLSKHQEENTINIIEQQDFINCQNCQKITAVVEGKCATCGEEICIVCGCTDSEPCLDGCFWARPNVCSACYEQIEAEDYEGSFS